MRINIYNTTDRQRIDRPSIRRLVKKVLKDERKDLPAVNIIIADGRYLRRLNEIFLNRKRTTNVISFNLGEVSEIYLCDKMARDSYELNYYIVHGLLHLLGYDHRNKREGADMHRKCAEYLSNE
ncbi:MAG: rRNA maturation RNAse YbeY [candidate division WOR-3 bacterium]|nr:rRNA maturation RNAse YbeY [candidate division WOR-3 bacterium]